MLTVLKVRPSVHAAYQSRGEGQGFSVAALHDKLAGVETGVSAAMVRETAPDLARVQDELGVRREAWLPGHEILIVDGNCLVCTAACRSPDGQRVMGQAIEVEGRCCRRIRVELAGPSRDGDASIDLATDLPDAVSADTVAYNLFQVALTAKPA